MIVNVNPEVITARLAARGAHSRFERQPDSSFTESRLYRDTADRLAGLGWPVRVFDATEQTPQQLTAEVCDRILITAVGEAA